jgi:hypothetical protein
MVVSSCSRAIVTGIKHLVGSSEMRAGSIEKGGSLVALSVVFGFLGGAVSDTQAQSIAVRKMSYPLSYYEDSNGGSAEEALDAGIIDAYDTKSFKIKIVSRNRFVYSDSKGARFSCRDSRTATTCSATFPVEGSDCTDKFTYSFVFNARRKRVAAIFEQLFACGDGGFIFTRHSGIAPYSVRGR